MIFNLVAIKLIIFPAVQFGPNCKVAGNILSCCNKLKPPISITPDRAPHERKIYSMLLHERWKLIKSGTDRKSIHL